MTDNVGNDPNGTGKLDSAAADGLLGVPGSMAYTGAEIERHLHNWERWMAAAAVPNGEIHVADPIGDNPVPFVADAGNDSFGAWVQIGGSGDTPILAGQVKFDMHRFAVVAWETNAQLYIVQVAFGESGAAALAAGDYTEFPFTSGQGTAKVSPIDILARRATAGTKCWVRVLAPGLNTSTISFFAGIHEYEG